MEELLKILREICPGVDFEKEEHLIDDELVDSLDLVTIVGEIMDRFSIDVSVDDLVPENFNSARSMMDLIEKYRRNDS